MIVLEFCSKGAVPKTSNCNDKRRNTNNTNTSKEDKSHKLIVPYIVNQKSRIFYKTMCIRNFQNQLYKVQTLSKHN